ETLGATDIIASDKTGTLTQNKMTVEKLYVDNQQYSAKEEVAGDSLALKIMNYANDVNFGKDEQLLGDPTETALIQFGLDKGFDVRQALKKEPRVADLPFDSNRKLMSTIHKLENGKFLVAVKGAPDVLLDRASQ